jgi:protein SCO1/2
MQPGDIVPDDVLQDQDGKHRRLSDWRGKVLAVTFVYTRCPLPNFCPLMERNFQAVQQAIQRDDELRGHVHLAMISFDPGHDTPAVLKERATARNADAAIWSYLTGTQAAIDHVCERFGVSAVQEDDPSRTFTHNLRTAVVDPLGRVATIYTGNEWTPEQMIDALKHALKGAKPES